MDKIEFYMIMNPPTATAQQKQFNRQTGQVYMKTEAVAARKTLMAHLAEHRPEEPFKGPVKVEIGWCYQNPNKKNGEWHESKPDLDNLEKDLLDCMTKLKFYEDDKHIVHKTSWKRWVTDIPGIFIKIQEAEEVTT